MQILSPCQINETLVLSYFLGVLPLQARAGAPKQLYVSHPQTLWLSTQHIYWEYQYWIQPNFIRSYYMSEDFEQREKWENSRRESAISLVGLWRRWGVALLDANLSQISLGPASEQYCTDVLNLLLQCNRASGLAFFALWECCGCGCSSVVVLPYKICLQGMPPVSLQPSHLWTHFQHRLCTVSNARRADILTIQVKA